MFVIAIYAAMCGASGWTDMKLLGRSKRNWLKADLPNWIPSHDTFGRGFAMLDAERFERFFMHWVSAVVEGEVVAKDHGS